MHGASNSIPDPVVGTGVETVEPENNEYRQAEHALPDLIESLIENTSSLEELVISSSSCVREQVSTTENDFGASFSSDEEIEFDSDVIARFVQEEDEPSTAEPTTVLSLNQHKIVYFYLHAYNRQQTKVATTMLSQQNLTSRPILIII